MSTSPSFLPVSPGERPGGPISQLNERLTIPAAASQEYVVSFTAVVYVSGLQAMEVQKTAVLKNVAFQMGKSYNIMVELNPDNLGLQPIVFDVVEVKGWVEGGEYAAAVTM